jgi:hypothetical protein
MDGQRWVVLLHGVYAGNQQLLSIKTSMLQTYYGVSQQYTPLIMKDLSDKMWNTLQKHFQFTGVVQKKEILNIYCFYMAIDVTHDILFWKSTHPKTGTTCQ